jgi:hypothetical protein
MTKVTSIELAESFASHEVITGAPVIDIRTTVCLPSECCLRAKGVIRELGSGVVIVVKRRVPPCAYAPLCVFL